MIPAAPNAPSIRSCRNVALIGFMGTGKTTVGSLLAQLLGFEFIDTDKIIEQRQNRRISDIFSQQGEAHFRQLEANLCTELENSQSTVIATGGGLPVNPDNLDSLRRHCLVACLWATPETIYARVRSQHHRPLLNDPDPLQRIRDLLSLRTPAYKRADIIVGVDFRSPIETARTIAASFRHGIPES